MRRFLTTSFVTLLLVISAIVAAPVAHATIGASCRAPLDCAPGIETCNVPAPPLQGPGTCVAVSGPVQPSSLGTSPSNYVTQSSQNADLGAKQPIDPNLGKTAEEGFSKVMISIMSLFAWLVGVAALTLDYAVYYTVVTMGDYVYNLIAVGVAWRIMRDLGNIFLIFGFLATGISIILNADLYGWGKKMLPKLLLAAVFLNFSLFISEAIIDTGNLFAIQFYTQINGGQVPTSNFLSAVTPSTEGISNKIMGQLGLQTIYTAGRVNQEVFKAGNTWIIGFMSIILFMITAFVMFSLAFVLIARFVTLLFLIILSPVGFAGSAVPALAERSKRWWDMLLKQTITAPILLLLLYVALIVITDVHFLTGICSPDVAGGGTCSKDWTGFVDGQNYAGFANMMLSFFIAIGLLLYVVYKAKDLGAIGATGATKLAGKLTFGATAWGLNRTAGRGMYHLQQRARQSATFNKIDAATGRAMSRTLDRGATATFDIRGIKAFGSKIDAGKPVEGGFVGARKREIVGQEKAAKAIEEAHKEASRPTKEQEELTNAHWEAQRRRYEAKEKLDIIKKNKNALPEDVARSEKILANAISAETDALKARTDADKAAATQQNIAINESKKAYAKGLTSTVGKVVGLAAYGPGTGAAARKIKDSLKEKPTQDKFLENAKKLAKEIEEAEGSAVGGEGGKKEDKREERVVKDMGEADVVKESK